MKPFTVTNPAASSVCRRRRRRPSCGTYLAEMTRGEADLAAEAFGARVILRSRLLGSCCSVGLVDDSHRSKFMTRIWSTWMIWSKKLLCKVEQFISHSFTLWTYINYKKTYFVLFRLRNLKGWSAIDSQLTMLAVERSDNPLTSLSQRSHQNESDGKAD